jgi:hypothetical protein
MAGAEIVERDAHAFCAQHGKVRLSVRRALDKACFGDLEAEAGWSEPCSSTHSPTGSIRPRSAKPSRRAAPHPTRWIACRPRSPGNIETSKYASCHGCGDETDLIPARGTFGDLMLALNLPSALELHDNIGNSFRVRNARCDRGSLRQRFGRFHLRHPVKNAWIYWQPISLVATYYVQIELAFPP